MARRGSGVGLIVGVIVGATVAFTALLAGVGWWAFSQLRERQSRFAGAPERESVEDEALRFRLGRPGAEWRLLDAAETAEINPAAVASALHMRGGGGGMVVVEPAYGSDLVAATDVVRSVFDAETIELRDSVPARVDGQPAMRFVRIANVGGMRVIADTAVLVHQDHIYQLYTWRPESPAATPIDPDAFFAAFHFLPGPVVYRRAATPPPDGEGELWRVRNGVFESAAYGLRITPPTDWVAAVGPDAEALDANAEVGLYRYAPDVTFVVIGSRLPGVDQETERTRLRESYLSRLALEDLQMQGEVVETVAGRPVVFTRWRGRAGFTFDYVHGVRVEGDVFHEIVGWSAAPGALTVHLRAGLGAISLLTPSEWDALQASVGREGEDAFVPGAVYRRGRYRSFATGVRWEAPSACWRAWVGTAAANRDADAVLMIECPRQAVRGAMWIDDAQPASLDAHQAADAELFGGMRDGEIRRAAFGEVGALASNGRYDSQGTTWLYALRTYGHGSGHVRVAVYHPVGAGPDAEREAAAALHAFGAEAAPRPEIESRAGYYEDRRFGFAIEVPGVQFRQEPQPAIGDAGTMVMGSTVGGMVGVVAVHAPDTTGLDGILDLMREGALGRASPDLFSTPTETTGTLAGQPCRILTFRTLGTRVTIHIFRRGHTAYALIQSPAADHASGFRFVEP